MPAHRRYEITALEFPIVYTGDGDHDRNGLLYTPDAFVPLLKWVRDRWRADDEWLPEAHRRDQLIGLVLDGLVRYAEMVRLLRANADAVELLRYRGRAFVPDDAEDPDLDIEPGWREVTQNYRATVDELSAALDELTGGDIREVSSSATVRATWTKRWTAGRGVLRAAIDQRLAEIDKEFVRDRPSLARCTGLAESDVDRLLLNDFVVRGSVGVGYDRVNPLRPVPVVRPLVLRARLGEIVKVRLRNETGRSRVGLHRQGAGLVHGVREDDGAQVGRNPDSTATREQPYTYHWAADTEGVWPVNDLADVRGTEDGTNVHGLFGAFVVEPADTWWRDPETGRDVTDSPLGTASDVDVIPRTLLSGLDEFVDFASDGDVVRPHREFTIFIHDEPEVHSALHIGGGEHTVMPLNYRAEPMPNRLPHKMREYARATEETGHAGRPGSPGTSSPYELRAVRRRIDKPTLAEEFWVGRRRDGSFIERVAGEEQHHSSWLFGDPVTPILRAYRGDPCRVRLVHAGIKETHVFHLHVHQWRAVPTDTAPPGTWNPRRGSQLLDSITIGPQTGLTIDPLYGSGSRQHLFGDVIWHCHLYPHFHHGMWGLWRSLDKVIDKPERLPDGTPSAPLVPLPGRAPEDAPHGRERSYPYRGGRKGFPQFVDARFPQKAPPPPAATPAHVGGRRHLLALPPASDAEKAAFAEGAENRPGAPFIPLDDLSKAWNTEAQLPVVGRLLSFDVVVRHECVDYNSIGWHDRRGHFYELTAVSEDGVAVPPELLARSGSPEPFFVRANHGDVVELRLHNELGTFGADHFDLTQLPVECGLHVHLVKFDVLAADGSSTGWNYLSGASCREAVGGPAPGGLRANVGLHRWVVDEEFGPCFFHDHLLANYRQKHGLFAALVAQPPGSTWTLPRSDDVAWSGAQAIVTPGAATGLPPYREAGLGVGDFVPLYGRDGKPLNPPGELGGDDDPGVMAVNYRNAPLTARGKDPSQWFAIDERRRARDPRLTEDETSASWLCDPGTPVIEAHPGERLRIRLIQGSHEEQHSFVTHGLRWRRDWGNPRSTLVNQQTLGISEAFTLHIGEGDTPLGLGDHLWRFSAMDDLWLGCWGLVRVLPDGQGPPLIPGTVAPKPRRRPETPDRDWVVRARRVEHEYDGRGLTDPYGLVYEVVTEGTRSPYSDDPSGEWLVSDGDRPGSPEPLVLRCSPGEWVRIRLLNEVRLPRTEERTDDSDEWTGPVEDPLLPRFGPEPHPPPLPLNPDRRTVSPRVSLHPSLLLYDVTTDDGAYVGSNRNSTVRPLPVGDDHGHGADDGEVVDGVGHGHERGNWREYWWYADEALGEGNGQVCYLHDMADIRNHRHHGLVGAIVVEPQGWVPDSYTGAHTTVRWWGRARDEYVLFWQDGLRHYVYGDLTAPVADVEPGDDPEDAGQKGVSYRTAPVHPRDQLADPDPSTPTWTAPRGTDLVLRLVGACDKPRNHTFTVHGAQWTAAPWVDGSPQVGALSGLTADVVHDIVPIVGDHPGDHAYRSGAFRWSVSHGMRGIIRRT